MASRAFEQFSTWNYPDGKLTPRAQGWVTSIDRFIGASQGQIPIASLGGDGVTTTRFLNETGAFSTPAYPVGANPTASVGETVVNGTALTFMRSDAAPPIDLGITPIWTGSHNFSAGLTGTSGVFSGDVTGANFAGGTTAYVLSKLSGTDYDFDWVQFDVSGATGNLSISRFNSGTGAGSDTFWRGDGIWSKTASGDWSTAGHLICINTGKGLQLKAAANCKMGTATLVGGTVTVSTTAVLTASKLWLSVATPGGTQGHLSAPPASITDATSFVINSDNALDTSTVNWLIIDPSP